MSFRKKLNQHSLGSNFKQMRLSRQRLQLLVLAILLILFCFVFYTENGEGQETMSARCAPIDVVYTWVNGSDPLFIAAAKRYDPTYDPTRFDDKHELRYSLRSLERYASWVRHVYIVTNGQIPNWLDLSYERVTVVPHESLAPDARQLPTFSSAAIETFLHRIPKLSKRFIYLNDDIFLGAPLYPEDLYTDSTGVRIYQAWMVPDCATDCPWTYIGDGACDRHCNIPECQYDGGDCNDSPVAHGTGQRAEQKLLAVTIKSTTPTSVQMGMEPKRLFPKQKSLKAFKRNSTGFKEYMRRKNMTTLEELHSVVDYFNNRKLQAVHNNATASSNIIPAGNVQPKKANKNLPADIYSQSLINTNMLLNHFYGFKARNVLAHVGFLLDRDIVVAMQRKFAKQVQTTADQRFRTTGDLQFAFAYYSFLMSETQILNVSQIFDEFDTDGSKTWSDREVRTLLARLYPPPLDWSAMHYFEQVVTNCSHKLGFDKKHSQNMVYSTLVYERYEDSTLPTITRELVNNCPLLADALLSNFAVRSKYKHHINSKRSSHNNFMMLTSNVSLVVDALDKLRRQPRKFNCINDNMDAKQSEDNELIRHLLEDFYLSLFPYRSKFELDPQYRNRFINWHDYRRWRRRKRAALVIGYGFSILLSIFLVRFLCVRKAKFIRCCVQKL